ncbi:MAG: sulfatase [Myxococcales bacterium]|nr:sulfatase [Myxococcales bacterium]
MTRLRLAAVTGGQTAITAWCLTIAAGLGRGLWLSRAAGYWREPWTRLAALTMAEAAETGLLAGFALALLLGVSAAANAALFRRRAAGFAASSGMIVAGAVGFAVLQRGFAAHFAAFLPAAYATAPGISPETVWRVFLPPLVERIATADPWPHWQTFVLGLGGLFIAGLLGGGLTALILSVLKRPRPETIALRWPWPAVLAVALGATAATMTLPSFAKSDGKHPDVILISIDTLRADSVGAYGASPSVTPRLDELAAGADLYRRVYAPSSWTIPSHASLLTGLAPWRHGAETMDARLPEEIVTLAERFAAAGYDTAAFVNSFLLSPRYGFGQGFRRYVTMPEESGAAVADEAARWLTGRSGRPVFLFVHLFDPHWPYGDPASSLPGAGAKDFHAFVEQALPTGEADRAAWRGQYLADVARADRAAGRVFDALRAAGRWEKAWVIVTGDHGEEFWEHGFLGHAITLYEEVLRVPLLVKRPEQAAAAAIERTVSLLDVPATLVNELALPGKADGDGLPLTVDAGASRDFLAASRLWGSPRFALIRDCRKGITDYQWRFGAFGGESPPRFYDLCSDPVESANLYRNSFSEQWMAGLFSLAGRLGGVFSPQAAEPRSLEKEQLRTLGYIQ